MLTLSKVQEIRRLLDEGQLSQRKIAAKLGVSRGTVGALASGKRAVYGREPNEQAQDRPPERCGGCGQRVVMPCVYCRAVDYRRRTHHRRAA